MAHCKTAKTFEKRKAKRESAGVIVSLQYGFSAINCLCSALCSALCEDLSFESAHRVGDTRVNLIARRSDWMTGPLRCLPMNDECSIVPTCILCKAALREPCAKLLRVQ